ncbi:MAG: M6 family metalloprotease domain-containing protein [Candidatus Eisenbacteria bacterium]|nr:M6 family metalloprotease domain-containing protein [Candidatus Eisenbacteria bacterium]
MVEANLILPRRTIASIAAALFLAAPSARATAPTPTGTVPPEVSQAFEDGLFRLPDRGTTATSFQQTAWRLPILMISFTDDSLVYTPQDFNFALFDTTHSTPSGSVYDYYRWVSGNRLTVLGNVVANVRLDHDHFYYGDGAWGLNASDPSHNMYAAIRDALIKCQDQVHWADYDLDHDGYVDMLWALHAGHGGEAGIDRNDFWSITSRMTGGWRYGSAFVTRQLVPGSTSQYMLLDRFSTLPELSYLYRTQRSEIGVYCHEFGHALGLPDLYDTSSLGGSSNMGPGNWALMSTGGYGVNGVSPDRPSHMGAWPMLFLGWASSFRPANDTTLTLAPIEQGGSIAEMWFQGESNAEHFLIENRQPLGFDALVPSPGLLVYHVDEAGIGSRLAANRINVGLTPGLQLVEADGDYDLTYGRNRGDANDPFPGALARTDFNDDTRPSTHTFGGAFTNMGFTQITSAGTDMRFRLNVRAPGWGALEDHTEAPFAPSSAYGPASTTAVDTFGTISTVGSETRADIPQIVLRERRRGFWEPAFPVSQSTAGAYEPTLAQLSNGDLAVAWRDQRDGVPRIYYRARIRGAWSSEQPVGNAPANSFQPALAADARGTVALAWLATIGSRPRVMFMRFAYLSPFGNPIAVSDSAAYPDAPALCSSADGHAYVIWPDRATYPVRMRFARYVPDSGMSAPLQLGPTDGVPQVGVAAAVDSRGVLHALWQENGSGGSYLHYQRRDFHFPVWEPDTVIEVQPGGAQNLAMAVDRQGALHVAFESAVSGSQEIRYRRWTLDRGWDAVSTEVSRLSDGIAHLPRLAPTSPGNVTVLLTGYPAGQPRFMTRDRWLDGIPQVAAAPPPAAFRPGIVLGPNPLRAGEAFELAWSGVPSAEPALADLYDLAGRRIATFVLAGVGSTRGTRVGASITAGWTGGLYFVRVRGTGAVARLVVIR